jgi:hypothetical protein
MSSKQQLPDVPGRTSEPQLINNKTKKHFRFSLYGDGDKARHFWGKAPMGSKSKNVTNACIKAIDVIISNNPGDGSKVYIRNFKEIKTSDYGFGRKVFLNVLNHLIKNKVITRNGSGSTKSTITYADFVPVPEVIKSQPPCSMLYRKDRRDKHKEVEMKTAEHFNRDKRIREYWDYTDRFKIDPAVPRDDFDILNESRKVVLGETVPLEYPDPTLTKPVASFNNPAASIGGRFYRAFWISMSKALRPYIEIDGELCADIDGKSMHVQLLYKEADEPTPKGDLYLYPKSDPRRKIMKNLMLYMMNSRKDYDLKDGRTAAIRTYNHHQSPEEPSVLEEYIEQLEELHKPILKLLYRSNWGRLQKTEADLMLNIMEEGMKTGILVLPVHDGCLCQLRHKEKVLELFMQQGIDADENLNQLNKPDINARREAIEEVKKLREEIRSKA